MVFCQENKLSMKRLMYISILFMLTGQYSFSNDGYTYSFKNQSSYFVNYNRNSDFPVYLGAREIPQFNQAFFFSNDLSLDFEFSANISASTGFNFADYDIVYDGRIKPYRV